MRRGAPAPAPAAPDPHDNGGGGDGDGDGDRGGIGGGRRRSYRRLPAAPAPAAGAGAPAPLTIAAAGALCAIRDLAATPEAAVAVCEANGVGAICRLANKACACGADVRALLHGLCARALLALSAHDAVASCCPALTMAQPLASALLAATPLLSRGGGGGGGAAEEHEATATSDLLGALLVMLSHTGQAAAHLQPLLSPLGLDALAALCGHHGGAAAGRGPGPGGGRGGALGEKAGWLLCLLASDKTSAPHLLAHPHAFDAICGHGRRGGGAAQSCEEAAWALATLSADADLSRCLAGRDEVVSLLAELLRAPNAAVTLQAVWAVANLSLNPTARPRLLGLGVLPTLLSRLPQPAASAGGRRGRRGGAAAPAAAGAPARR